MILKDILEKTTHFFKGKDFESPRLDAELLIADVLNFSRIELYTNHLYPLDSDQVQKCRDHVVRRGKGEPVAYILGYKDFYRSRFFVTPNVLIPRPETEILVESAVEWIKKTGKGSDIIIADFGAGSGCVGLSLAKEIPNAKVYLFDISSSALDLARKNSVQLNIEDRINFVQGDINQIDKSELGFEFDLIVANPPYIDKGSFDFDPLVKEYEPNEALFSDEKGLFDEKNWAAKAFDWLTPDGAYFTEIGFDQGDFLKEHFEQELQFQKVKILKDYSNFDRLIVASKSSSLDA